MITIKKEEDIEKLRVSGERLANVLHEVSEVAKKPGVLIYELNVLAEKLIRDTGDTPAFLGYKPCGSSYPYPLRLCVSVNDEVVHGIPEDEERSLKDGDIVGLDLGLIHKKMITDSAVTVGVGKVDQKYIDLMNVTRKMLYVGIEVAVAGNTIGDIGHAMQKFAEPYGYGLVEELGGHGVGYGVHEEPFIPNFGKRHTGPELKPGMVLALEPMLNMGSKKVFLSDDGYTFKTADGKRSAHFEHTILITNGAPEVLTEYKGGGCCLEPVQNLV